MKAAHDDNRPALHTARPIYESALVPPRIPPTLARRPRVARLMERVVERRLTVVSAPAGYGKTVALSDWRARAADDIDVAWLTLDERDTAPPRFWQHAVAAVERVAPDVLVATRQRVDRQDPLEGEAFVRGLVNDLCRTARETVIVIDDYHVTHDDTLRDLTDLIAHLPPNVHVVLACRADPLLPLLGWKADGTLLEIRAADLRFTDAEAEAFIDLVVPYEIDPAQRATLRRRCDGWIAGLHLATIGILESADPTSFVDHMASTFSPIGDYLVSEVVAHLDPALRDFVLDTSVLDELAAPICDAVAGRRDSATVLANMRSAGLFLSASAEPGVYRYHPLFRSALMALLRDEDVARFARAHRRAASWLVEHGMVRDAVLQALAAKDHTRAAQWLSEHADRLLMSGPDALADLLHRLPRDAVRESEDLQALEVRAAITRGSLPELERSAASHADPTTGPAPSARFRLAAAALGGRFDDTLTLLAEPAVAQLPIGERELAAGKALTAVGRVEDGAHRLRLALEQPGSDRFLDVAAASVLAWNRVVAGHLRVAKAMAQRTMDQAAAVGIRWFREVRFSELALAQVSYDRGLLGDAYRKAQVAVDAPDHCALSRVEGAILLARIEWALGNRQRARDVLAAAFVGPDDRPVTGVLSLWLALTRAELHLKERSPELAESWLPDWRTRVEQGPSSPFERLVLARFLIEDDRGQDARDLLVAEGATADRTTRYLLDAWRLDAIAAARANDPTAPMALEISYSMAVPEGFAQGYVEDAPALATVARSGDSGVTATVGVAHSALAGHRATTLVGPSRSAVTLIDELTDRELDVLRLLPSRLSNNEIASRLFVSVNTVKSHVKSIYRKLGVTSRNAAVAQATALRLT